MVVQEQGTVWGWDSGLCHGRTGAPTSFQKQVGVPLKIAGRGGHAASLCVSACAVGTHLPFCPGPPLASGKLALIAAFASWGSSRGEDHEEGGLCCLVCFGAKQGSPG